MCGKKRKPIEPINSKSLTLANLKKKIDAQLTENEHFKGVFNECKTTNKNWKSLKKDEIISLYTKAVKTYNDKISSSNEDEPDPSVKTEGSKKRKKIRGMRVRRKKKRKKNRK